MHRVLLAAALVTVLAIPRASRADQFVLFDETFTFTKADADNSKPSKSHYYVKGDKLNKDRPRDWTAPNGTVHIRTEVIEKPAGGEPTTWTLCYIPNKGQGNGYGCTGTDLYRETGVYEKDVSMKSFWQNDAIVWTEGIKQMDLVIKDNSGGSGHAHKRADHEKFFPTKMRITMIQVSAGSKYDPSLVPNLPREDAKKAKPNDGQAPAEKKEEACRESSESLAVRLAGWLELYSTQGQVAQFLVGDGQTSRGLLVGGICLGGGLAIFQECLESGLRLRESAKPRANDSEIVEGEPQLAEIRRILGIAPHVLFGDLESLVRPPHRRLRVALEPINIRQPTQRETLIRKPDRSILFGDRLSLERQERGFVKSVRFFISSALVEKCGKLVPRDSPAALIDLVVGILGDQFLLEEISSPTRSWAFASDR